MPPRAELRKLGITYRRIPVLAVGPSVFFDTSLALQALERAFPTPALAAGPNGGLEQAGAFWWTDRAIFSLAGMLLPWEQFPEAFRKDRGEYSGRGDVDPARMKELVPHTLSALRSHLALVEGQLARHAESGQSQGFFTGTDAVTYLDLSLFFVLDWISNFPAAAPVFKPSSAGAPLQFPHTQAWLARVRAAGAAQQAAFAGQVTHVSGDEAAALIWAASAAGAGHGADADADEPLLAAGYLRLGQKVKVTPTDTGKVAQEGVLAELNATQSVLRVETEGGVVFVHAPRLQFEVVAA